MQMKCLDVVSHVTDSTASLSPVFAHALDVARTLIGFATISENSNLQLVDWLVSYLQGYGVDAQVMYDPSGTKANVFATLGELKAGGIILSGHTDVVPAAGQRWASDPFTATLRNGRLFGRGACDMKGFIAMVLAMVPELMSSPRHCFHLALTYDEEVGAHGAQRLMPWIAEQALAPSACIVGEPTSMSVVVAHKGRQQWRCIVSGTPAHSSVPEQGGNAIHCAARLQAFIHDLSSRLRKSPLDAGFDVPYTTLQVCKVAGGSASNIVPEHCDFEFEIRYLPGYDCGQLIQEIKAYANGPLSAEMERVGQHVRVEFCQSLHTPELNPGLNGNLAHWVRKHAHQTGHSCVAYSTEAGFFQGSGIPTIICGPGSIAQAHKADEFVTLDQLSQCEGFLRLLAQDGHWPSWEQNNSGGLQ